jgi:hypothetical protein
MKSKIKAAATAIAAALFSVLSGAPASSQTAADINRLNAAMQICASPMGAGLAECRQLRGQLGASPLPLGTPGQDSALATAQAAQAYRMCVAANPNNYGACQAALAAQSAPGIGNVSTPNIQVNAPPAKPTAPPLDPLAGLLGAKP